jgi:uncharacterized membrane protein YagU involved in acid resistance
LNFLFVLAVGLLAGTISGIVGTGSSIMLMPVLVYQYGPKQAVPIMPRLMGGISPPDTRIRAAEIEAEEATRRQPASGA